MAWGQKPYRPALPIIMPYSNAVGKATNAGYIHAAIKDPYPGVRPTYTGVVNNTATQNAKPLIARFAFFNFLSTNNGKKPLR